MQIQVVKRQTERIIFAEKTRDHLVKHSFVLPTHGLETAKWPRHSGRAGIIRRTFSSMLSCFAAASKSNVPQHLSAFGSPLAMRGYTISNDQAS
jgi:hypothetical protein